MPGNLNPGNHRTARVSSAGDAKLRTFSGRNNFRPRASRLDTNRFLDEQGLSSHVFMTERDGPMTPKAFHALFGRIGARVKDAIPDTSAHAVAWLRPNQRRPRHTGATGLARPQEHSAHGALHRAVAASVQGLLALIVGDRGIDHDPPGGVGVMGPAGGWQLRDCAGWMCAVAPCTMTGVSTGSRLQDHDHAE